MNNEHSAPADRPAVDVSLLLLRVIVGVIFAAHGSQNLRGVWGGDGLAVTVEKMGGGPLPYLVTIGEFFGGLGLIVGFLTRFSAASLIVIMIGAIAMVHGKNGFFNKRWLRIQPGPHRLAAADLPVRPGPFFDWAIVLCPDRRKPGGQLSFWNKPTIIFLLGSHVVDDQSPAAHAVAKRSIIATTNLRFGRPVCGGGPIFPWRLS